MGSCDSQSGSRGGGGRARRAVLLWAVLFQLLSAAVPAQDLDWKEGRLGHLAPYIGTYRYDAVLGDPAVDAALRTLAGDAADTLVRNMSVRPPVEFVEGNLVLRGNAPHQGGSEEAMVLVKIYDGTVRAALLHDGRMRLFADDAEFVYVPRVLRDFLRPRDNGRAALPPGVEWHRLSGASRP